MATPAGGGTVRALRVSVISPEQTLYDGEATQVVAPAANGSLGILRGHAPLMALLGKGTLRIEGPQNLAFEVSGGFLQVADDVVTVITETARPV